METAFQIRGDWDTVEAAARLAESAGVPALALPDHYLQPGSRPRSQVSRVGRDALAQLAAIAATTQTVQLVVLVAPVTFRHPGVLYQNAITIDEISRGRFTLGVGTGWLAEEFEVFGLPFPDLDRRYALLEEALAYLRAAMAGTAFAGDHFRLQPVAAEPRPRNLRLAVGGTGPRRTPALAGRWADEYNAYVQPPEALAERIAVAAESAAAAGRTPPFVSTASAVVVGRTDAEYRDRLAQFAAVRGMSVGDTVDLLEAQGIPHGSAPSVREHLHRLADAGVARYYVQLLGETSTGEMHRILECLTG